MALEPRPEVYELSLKTLWIDLAQHPRGWLIDDEADEESEQAD